MGNIPENETFDGTYPFAPHFSEAPGFRMHYVDEGKGEPIVCLHGFPTWGYLYRNLIPPLSRHNRVIVPDHMGYGKSETPPDRIYTFFDHTDNLEKLLVDDLDLHDITLVLHDIGGPIGSGFALRNPDRIKRLFVLDTMVMGVLPEEEMRGVLENYEVVPYINWIRKIDEQERFEEIYGNLDITIYYMMTELLQHDLDATTLRAYASAFPSREEHRGARGYWRLHIALGSAAKAQAAYDGDEPLSKWLEFSNPPEGAAEKLRKKPAMMAYGQRDMAIEPEPFMNTFKKQFPGAPVIEVDAGHWITEDAPGTIAALLELFMYYNP